MNELIIIALIAAIWIVRKFVWNIEEGTNRQRKLNPELNTKSYELHEKRLKQFSKSKYKNRMFYLGTDGSCYYYSATGRKVFC
tara:strand:- start:845 stop:1093 length:249 start_codon:yes stop_codon:yes gene_type:complete